MGRGCGGDTETIRLLWTQALREEWLREWEAEETEEASTIVQFM
jgi:hypothetical protein